ncbi:MAG TPA: tetratricopeptide repeat protein [Rectinemataceae bacterium]|nr:tetratricopeptide repeat protein [Rectinemataceae bacterium]
MESLSRTLDTYTGSYLVRRRRKRLAILLAVCAASIAGAAIIIELSRSGVLHARSASRPVPKQELLAAWNVKNWDKVIAGCTSSLDSAPLDPFYLMFKGFSSFYKALELPEGDDRTSLIDNSVATLRKALATGRRLPRAEVDYVLAKAYYQKGPSYLDESVKYMEAALAGGYKASDSREYLAMAYAGLGDKTKSVQNFQAALEQSRAELLLLAAAKAYDDSGDAATAESLLLEALASGKDALVDEKCHFLLGDIYRSQGQGPKAEEQYNQILEKNQDSAEAHYRLGLVYQDRGETVRARAEWRKAVSIDPTNAAAREKLTEKL